MNRSRYNPFWHDRSSESNGYSKRESFLLESLESRLLLSADLLPMAGPAGSFDSSGPATIVWTNRGAASDNFDDVFGANAPVARSVVDAAIASWNRVITDFNYSDGSSQFDLTLSMAGSGTGTGASASFPSNIIDGKPQAGTITISRGNDIDGDGNGDGAGFFIDPTPFESSEFAGNIVNAFAGDAQAGSPAAGLSDLYTVALLELTHEMGITSDSGLRYQTGDFLVSTGVSDPAGNGSGFFWVFDGPSINALMTSFDSGAGGTDFGPGVHSAEGGAGETFNYNGVNLFGSEDSANAFFEFGRRYLVSNKDALILKDAYNYDIVMPETFGTFYSLLDESTGEVLVRGGAGASADNISVTRDGTDVVVSVDLGTDVVGLGPTDAFVTRYSHGEAVTLDIQSGDGDDNITIGPGLGLPVTIDAGLGNDYVNVSSNAGFPVMIDGNGGNDTLIANSDVTIIGGAGDDLIIGSDGNDTLSGNSGNDTIYGLGGNDNISGGADNDTIYAGTGNNVVSDGTGDDIVDLSENAVAISYTTGGGNDTVIGTAFDDTITGSSGNDRLEGRGGNDLLLGEGGADVLIGGNESDTFVWNPGDGSDIIEGGIGNDTLIFNGSAAGEDFALSAAGTRLDLTRNVGGISMDVAGVEQVNINAMSGADTVTVNDLTATDVQVVNIDLGPGDGVFDSVFVNGRAIDDDLTATVSAGVVTVAGLDYDVHVSSATTTDSLVINGNAGNDTIKAVSPVESTIQIVLNGGAGNDYLSADATLNGGDGNDILIGGVGNDILIGGDGDDLLDGRGSTTANTLIGGSGTDTILVSGTAGADMITTTHVPATSFNIVGGLSAGNNSIDASIEAVRIEAGDGPDMIIVNVPSAGGLNYTVLGGNPIGAPGDVLQVSSSATATVTAGPENDAGSVDLDTVDPTNVSYDEIELLIVDGGGGGVINGTNGPDAITIVARDDSYNGAADGVQDFTVSVNTGPEILFINTPTLTVNALAGSDQVTVQAPAPNNAVWDVDVTINGDFPAGDTDTVIVQTPTPDPEMAVYTPTSFDGGTLDLVDLSSLITINTSEVVIYDGQGDGDSLTVVGTAGDDTIIHTPGVNDEAGTFQVNSLLAVSYQNLGSGGSLTADGDAGSDTLIYNGTAGNDSFTIGALGEVNLNSRLVLNTTAVETLTLEGFDGDDSFMLIPAISASVYPTININGGGEASASGDRVYLTGTPGDDVIMISGQSVSLGGVTVNSSGVENIQLDALGGNDIIIYNGVIGVTENITVSSSGIAGGGQINVPDVTQIDFSSVEQIDVNGNAPTPTETDTLTIAGTNADDTFDIHLDAAGTTADPILTLQDGGGTTLLTLRNYTNFDTLNVLGLDGEDTFNVYTSDSGLSRNLFVDGGLPDGKNKSTDQLNVFYTPKRPHITHSMETQNHDAGIVDLDYGTARFVVQYDDVEKVTISKS